MAFMSTYRDSQGLNDPQQLSVTLELLSEGFYEADRALVGDVGRATVEGLEGEDGYIVQPVARGQRGGDFVVQVLTTLATVPVEVWTHKELVERVMTDAGTLVTVCVGVVPLVRRVFQAHKRQEEKRPVVLQPIKMTLEIAGQQVTVEAQDVEGAEAGIKVAARFYGQHTDAAKKVTARSSVKVKGAVPAQPQRKRR